MTMNNVQLVTLKAHDLNIELCLIFLSTFLPASYHSVILNLLNRTSVSHSDSMITTTIANGRLADQNWPSVTVTVNPG